MKAERVIAIRKQLLRWGFQEDKPTRFTEEYRKWATNDKITIAVDNLGHVFTRPGRTINDYELKIIRELCPDRVQEFASARLNYLLAGASVESIE